MHKIEFYKHNLDETDRKECVKVLKSLFLTTGDVVAEFENKFSQYLNLPYTLGITSCTEGLFLSLKAIGIKPGDEVITTPLTFVATANAIEFCGAKPVFVDVNEFTGNINPENIEKAITANTKAIIPVHLYGQMCDMKKIRSIADKYGIKVVEDAAHCVEGKRDNIGVGELGDFAVFSFYAVKNLTCGEGGAIVCRNPKYYEWIKKARLHGLSKSAADRYSKKYMHYDMEFLGYKANMNNIQASLLINQLDRLETLRERKEEIAKRYDSGFKNNNYIKTPAVLSNTKHARHLYTIWVDPTKRDEYIHSLQEHGIGVAVNFRAVHLMKYYKNKYSYEEGVFSIAERIGFSTITLPFYPKLTDSEIDYVIEIVNKVVTL